jgi:hypothetical protein
MYLDQFGNPLPAGTALRVPALFHHQGIVDYDDATGEQVMLHNSKKRGRAAQTDPAEFNNGRFPVALARPLQPERIAVIVQRARGTRSHRNITSILSSQSRSERPMLIVLSSPTTTIVKSSLAWRGFFFLFLRFNHASSSFSTLHTVRLTPPCMMRAVVAWDK